MKTNFRLILILIVLTMLLLCLISCKVEKTEANVICMDENVEIKTIPYSSLDSFIPQKEGYIFDGWYLDKDTTKPISSITSTTVIYAKWKFATFSVKFVDKDGKTILVDGKEYQIVEYNKSAKAPTAPSVDGYSFIGWNKEFNSIKSNLTISALYSPNKYTLNFYDEDNEIIATKTTTINEDLSAYFNTLYYNMQQDADDGFYFAGWKIDSELVDLEDINTTSHIYPVYNVSEINNFSIASNLEKNEAFYDEDLIVKLSPCDFIEYPNIDYSYTWFDQNNNEVFNGKEFNIHNPFASSYTYSLKITASANDSMQEKIMPCTFNIKKANLNTIVAEKISTSYSSEYITFNNIKNLQEGDVVKYSLDDENYSTIAPKLKNAGDYKVYAKIYRENYNPQSVNFNVSIAKKEVLATISSTLTANYGERVDIICDFNGLFENDESQIPKIEYVYKKSGGIVYAVCSSTTKYTPGEYEIGVSDDIETDNYIFSFNKGKLTINKATLLINLKNKEITYGQPAPNFEYESVTGLVSGDSIPEITYSTNYLYDALTNKYSNAGTYEIFAQTSEHENYNINFNNANLTVKKAPLSIKVNSIENLEYGSDVPSFNYELNGLVNHDSKEDLDFTPIYLTNYKKSSDYTKDGFVVSMSEFSLQNYEPTFNSGLITMKKALLEAKVKPLSITYGMTPNYEIEYSGFKNDDDQSVINEDNMIISGYEALSGVKDDGYEITLSNLFANNYEFNYIKSTLTVLAKPINVYAKPSQINYGDNKPAFEFTCNDFVGEDNLIENLTFTCEYENGCSVGEYDVTPSIGTNKNYIISYFSNKLTVLPRNITIHINPIEVTFGDPIEDFSYSKIDNLPMVCPVSDLNINYFANEYNNTACRIVKDGGYEITATINNANFNATIIPASITVLPREVEVRYTKKALFKQDEMFSVNASKLTYINLVNSTLINGNLQLNENALGKTYTSAEDNSLGENFIWANLSASINGTDVLSSYIFKYSLSIELVNKQFNYDAHDISTTYDGQTHSPSVIVDNLSNYKTEFSLNNIDYSSTISFKNVVDTILYFKITDLNEQDPCEVVIDTINVNIQPAQLEINAIGNTIKYGDPTPSLNYTISGFVNNENEDEITPPSISTNYCQYNQVGEYAILVSGASSNNYTFIYKNAKLIVEKKTVTAKVQDIQVVYGDEIAEYSINYTNLARISDIENIDISNARFTTPYTISSPVNEYVVEVSNLQSINYNFIYQSGKITVLKKSITIKAKDCQTTYGQNAPDFEIEAVNDSLSEAIAVTFSCAYTQSNNVGQYPIFIENATSNNYDFTFEQGVLTVNKRPASIILHDKSIDFGEEAPEFSSEVTNLVNGDVNIISNITYTCSYVAGDNVGEYTISAAVENATNYIFTYVPSKLTVCPKTVNITFGGTNTFKYTGFDQKDSIEAYYTNIYSVPVRARAITSPADFINAGNYTVSAVIDDTNYIANVTSCMMSIIKGDYENISHRSLSGVYDPEKSLLDYPLDANFSYVSSSEVPVCNKVQYDIIYNADPSNYNNYLTTVDIVLEKALCDVENNIFETVYNSETYLVNPIIEYKGVPLNSALYDLEYSNGNNFLNAATYSTKVTMTSDNYKLEPTALYIKIKGVAIADQYYTIEDALNVALNGDTIIVKNSTEFAGVEISAALYNNLDYYTVKSGVTLLVPYDDTYDTSATTTPTDAPTSYTIGSTYRELRLQESTNLIVNGTINVNAKRASSSTPYQGIVYGNYGLIDVPENACITVKNGGVISANGFVTGKGNVELESGAKSYEAFAMVGFKGGSISKEIYKSLFIVDQYYVQNIEAHLIVNEGANVYGRYAIYVNKSYQKGDICIIGSGGAFELASKNGEPGRVSKYLNLETGVLEIKTLSGITTTTAISFKIAGLVTINTNDTEFPIPGNVNLIVSNNSEINCAAKFKFMPGAQLIIEEGGKLTDNGNLYMYDGTFTFNPGSLTDTSGVVSRYYYSSSYMSKHTRKVNGSTIKMRTFTENSAADLFVYGNMEINGKFGGSIQILSDNASVNVNAASLTNSVKISTDVIASKGFLGLTTNYDCTINTVELTSRIKLFNGEYVTLQTNTIY